jgi:methylthioribose-1-phosphate isomerase
MIPTIAWHPDPPAVRILDQTRLPAAEVFLDLTEVDSLCEAIATLRVRGAPAIGIAGGYGVALAALRAAAEDEASADARVEDAAARLRAVRPTATNLAWGVARVRQRYRDARAEGRSPGSAAAAALAEAGAIHEEDLEASRAMGRAGAALVPRRGRVLTHCNTGGLATGGLGTALAVVFEAARAGREPSVFVDETRPLLQGARLTAWELEREGIAATLIVDGAAAWLMASRGVDLILVGADRIAANGDTANKVGTYGLAVAAARHRVPFYVVAPLSTFDATIASGSEIPVEERAAEEVRSILATPIAPRGVPVWNPAFDVTPAELIAGWVTERGLLRPPFRDRA